AQALPGTVPCGARTFLGIVSDDATVWPTPPWALSHAQPPSPPNPLPPPCGGSTRAAGDRGDLAGLFRWETSASFAPICPSGIFPRQRGTKFRFGLAAVQRSEERRVGKECRSRWSTGEYKS